LDHVIPSGRHFLQRGDVVNISAAIAHHYFSSGPIMADRYQPTARALPAAVLARWRAGLHCAGCGLAIAAHCTPTVRADSAFHPSCAKRTAAAARSSAAPSSDPRTIGAICGVALPFGVQCFIPQGEQGDRYERFAPTCFDRSIAAGGQTVQIDHTGVPVPGRLTLYTGADLRFRLHVSDTPFGRATWDRATRGEFSGCSIRFRATPGGERWTDGHVIEVREAELIEVSLCAGGRPTWYGTHVWIEGA
jgi:HK97 family phage prohead protease